MRKTTLASLLLASLCCPLLSQAKVVSEAKKAFSVDVPDAWTPDEKKEAWGNANDTGAILLGSLNLSISLDEWVNRNAQQHLKTKVSDDTLGGMAAKRLDFEARGFKTHLWLAKKGNVGIMVTLVHNDKCPDDIPALRKKLLSSFKWSK